MSNSLCNRTTITVKNIILIYRVACTLGICSPIVCLYVFLYDKILT